MPIGIKQVLGALENNLSRTSSSCSLATVVQATNGHTTASGVRQGPYYVPRTVRLEQVHGHDNRAQGRVHRYSACTCNSGTKSSHFSPGICSPNRPSSLGPARKGKEATTLFLTWENHNPTMGFSGLGTISLVGSLESSRQGEPAP